MMSVAKHAALPAQECGCMACFVTTISYFVFTLDIVEVSRRYK